MINLRFRDEAASPEQQQAREKFQTMLKAAFTTPANRQTSLPFTNPNFFCPGVVQREFIVAAAGDKIKGREITHIATEFVSTCQALILHARGERPVTGIAHLDWNTNLRATIDAMLTEFTVKPTHAEIYSTAFQPMQRQLFSSMGHPASRVEEFIRTLERTRDQNIIETAIMLAEKDIPVRSIDLSNKFHTFIADVNEGKIWNGEEPPQSIFHHRDVDRVLAEFFKTGQDQKNDPAFSPYRQVIARNVIALPWNSQP